MTLDSAQHL